MTRAQAAKLELIELALRRGVSWAAIARTLHPKMDRWEAKIVYRDLCRLRKLEEAGVISG